METKTYILKCPNCGTEKKVTFSAHLLPDSGYIYWSDGRVECDGWKETIRTHQCPSCGKFYAFSSATNLREDNTPCDDNGQLSYETLKQAIAELSGDDYAESWARLEAWRAYNIPYIKIQMLRRTNKPSTVPIWSGSKITLLPTRLGLAFSSLNSTGFSATKKHADKC